MKRLTLIMIIDGWEAEHVQAVIRVNKQLHT